MKIIVIEDEIRIRDGIISLLGRLPGVHTVTETAGNGTEGLELIKTTPPDLVITDIRLPGMDGLEMLEKLAEESISIPSIILSAYSEFEYARKAIRLGVLEYLVKPVSLDAFTKAVAKAEKVIASRESASEAGSTLKASPDDYLAGHIFGRSGQGGEIFREMEKLIGSAVTGVFAVLALYFENSEDKVPADCTVIPWLERQNLGFFCPETSDPRRAVYLLYGMAKEDTIRDKAARFLAHQVKERADAPCALLWRSIASAEAVREEVLEALANLDKCLTAPGHLIIDNPPAGEEEAAYPADLETKAKAAICSGDFAGLRTLAQEAYDFLVRQNRDPGILKDGLIRFILVLYNLLAETASGDLPDLKDLIKGVSDAVTRGELAKVFFFLFDRAQKPLTGTSLPVLRAEKIIREQHRQGISLSEIADQLDMSPGYLGHLFRRETGKSFNDFLKEIRIREAKALLLQTNRKLYDITSEVGFSDPKYFSKVFRQVTGMLPYEYRKLQKK
jgi:two-component system, response regulator YesN